MEEEEHFKFNYGLKEINVWYFESKTKYLTQDSIQIAIETILPKLMTIEDTFQQDEYLVYEEDDPSRGILLTYFIEEYEIFIDRVELVDGLFIRQYEYKRMMEMN